PRRRPELGIQPVHEAARRRRNRDRGEADLQRPHDRVAGRGGGGAILLEVARLDRLIGDEKRDDVRRCLLLRRGGRGRQHHQCSDERAPHLSYSTREASTVPSACTSPCTSTSVPFFILSHGPFMNVLASVVRTVRPESWK